MRSEQAKLAREESIAYESRYLRWAASFGVESDSEEFLLNANVFLSSEMDRVKFAYLELTQGEIDNAENEEVKAARETGNRLFSDPRGVPASMYGTRRFNVKKPGGPSWGSGAAPALEPEELLEELGSRRDEVLTGCWAFWKENCWSRRGSVSGPPGIDCGWSDCLGGILWTSS